MNKLPAIRKPPSTAHVKFQDSDIFFSACVSGDEDELEDLLDKGANVNTSTIDGVTALHQAVIDNKFEMVRFLVNRGADINAQDNEGWTPLHVRKFTYFEVLSMFLGSRLLWQYFNC